MDCISIYSENQQSILFRHTAFHPPLKNKELWTKKLKLVGNAHTESGGNAEVVLFSIAENERVTELPTDF
jgi:hypothetical protein